METCKIVLTSIFEKGGTRGFFVPSTHRRNPCGPGTCAHGARPHKHPAVTVGGPHWHSVCDGFHVFLVLGQHFRIVVIMRLRMLATIAIDPLFEIIRTIVAINSCNSPRSHFGTSSVPPPTTMGADPASAFFLWRQIAIHIQQEGPLSPGPFRFTP